MTKQPMYTAIDLGTDKCVTIIGTKNEHGQLQVSGVCAVPSEGIKRSSIIDLERVINTLSESVSGAERMAGVSIKSAFVSINGAHIHSRNSTGVVAVANPNQEIIGEDVERVIESARAVSLPNERTIIHVIPRDFKVDSQGGIKDPIGMTGIRLKAETHIVTGMSTAMTNLEKAIHDIGLAVDGFVFSGLASSEIVISETERELGIVVVDIGAGTTSISAFVEGSHHLSTALPVGARHITQDIALGCRMSIEAAEKIKVALSSQAHAMPEPRPGESKDELNKRRKAADKLDPRTLGINEDIGELSKKTIIEGIMVPRMKEMMTLIGQTLHEESLFPLVPAGIVFTGGGAKTIGLEEVAHRVLRLPVRVAQPPQILGLTRDMQSSAYTTVLGLLQYGMRHGGSQVGGQQFDPSALLSKLKLDKAIKSVQKLVQSLLP